MSLIQASRPGGGGGGGGGITISGYAVDVYTQATNFNAGLTLALSNTPVSDKAVEVDYNGQRMLYGTNWSYNAGVITVLFADPYVTTYDQPSKFQITYAY